MTKYLTTNQVIEFHAELLKKFGGLSGIRDKNLLHSALDAPKAAFDGKEMYPTIYAKAAAYLYHLARNHPFNDGNKRTAFIATIAFLQGNKAKIRFEMADLEQVVVEVANGKISKQKIESFLKKSIIS